MEKIRCEICFVENEKAEENLSGLRNQKVAHCKLNSLLNLDESFGVEEVATLRKWRSNRVLKKLLIILRLGKKELIKTN